MTEKILLERPFIRTVENFLTQEECKLFRDYIDNRKFDPGMVVDPTGNSIVDNETRYSDITVIDDDFAKKQEILDRVSILTGFDKSRFERPTVLKYSVGQFFKNHQDFFIYEDSDEHRELSRERCKQGGNRVSTILLYLNDDFEGGETYFPWDRVKVIPKSGSLLQFDYSYDNAEDNLRSQHISMPVIVGTKYAITIWVREQDRSIEVDNFKLFDKERDFYSKMNDINYELECGPKNDRRTFQINLPANDDPMNVIFVGFTGGLDSSLVLFLLGVLNNLQPIPYHIVPIYITSKFNIHDPEMLKNDFEGVENICKHIQSLGTKNIKGVLYVNGPIDAKGPDIVRLGLINAFRGWHESKEARMFYRFYKPKFIFTGDMQRPRQDHARWENIHSWPERSQVSFWQQPFYDLFKEHVIDALIQLGREDLIEKTPKCVEPHNDLLEICYSFPCNERRWGFHVLNKEMGEKYLLNLGEPK